MILRRNTCERVKSCSAQIESTVASTIFGNRNAVDGSDSFNVLLLSLMMESDDVVLFDWRSGDETRR